MKKILVVGAGAVGGYFGGRLALAGNDVTFLARGRRLAVLKEIGLVVESIDGDFTLDFVNAAESSEGEFDLVLIAVKAFGLEEAVSAVKKNINSKTTVVSLLNGVDSEHSLTDAFGSEKVIGGITFIGSTLLENGVIRHSAAGSVTIGEMAGGINSGRCDEIERLFAGSGVRCKVSGSIQTDIWAKMLWNVGFNAVTAVTGAWVSEVLGHPETERVIVDAMEEARRVSVAEGVVLPDDIVLKTVEKTRKAGKIRTSMLQDLERSSKTEVDTLNGAIVRLGYKHGIPAPVNETLLRLVLFREKRACPSV